MSGFVLRVDEAKAREGWAAAMERSGRSSAQLQQAKSEEALLSPQSAQLQQAKSEEALLSPQQPPEESSTSRPPESAGAAAGAGGAGAGGNLRREMRAGTRAGCSAAAASASAEASAAASAEASAAAASASAHATMASPHASGQLAASPGTPPSSDAGCPFLCLTKLVECWPFDNDLIAVVGRVSDTTHTVAGVHVSDLLGVSAGAARSAQPSFHERVP